MQTSRGGGIICIPDLLDILREGVDERGSGDGIHWHSQWSPCVVPSWDERDEPPINKSVGSRNVLMRTVAIKSCSCMFGNI